MYVHFWSKLCLNCLKPGTLSFDLLSSWNHPSIPLCLPSRRPEKKTTVSQCRIYPILVTIAMQQVKKREVDWIIIQGSSTNLQNIFFIMINWCHGFIFFIAYVLLVKVLTWYMKNMNYKKQWKMQTIFCFLL